MYGLPDIVMLGPEGRVRRSRDADKDGPDQVGQDHWSEGEAADARLFRELQARTNSENGKPSHGSDCATAMNAT